MLQSFNPKNAGIQVFVKDRLYPRHEARVSVFDSSVQGGDAVWEGLRVYHGKIMCLSHHLRRLRESAKALHFSDIPSDEFVRSAIRQALAANDMTHDTHIRLTLTRGEKVTSGMDPRLNQAGSCLIVLAEWKPVVYDNTSGIRAITGSVLRNSPRFLDSKIHHNNLLNNILAKIQANVAGMDVALMLDERGFAAEFNDTNVCMIRGERLLTPHAVACLPGITRGLVLDLAARAGLEASEADISLTELYNADAVFATGTMGELTPVVELDGRSIPSQECAALGRLQAVFREATMQLAEEV